MAAGRRLVPGSPLRTGAGFGVAAEGALRRLMLEFYHTTAIHIGEVHLIVTVDALGEPGRPSIRGPLRPYRLAAID
jgi:hypothetical protein